MAFKDKVEQLIHQAIEETDIFLVDYTISNANVIHVWIDTPEGINIDECVKISRFIEHSLDREEEDFELQVSSPGLDMPLKIMQQYKKNIGRDLKITLTDGKEVKGTLLETGQDSILMETSKKEKIEGKKKKQLIKEKHNFDLSQIASAKVVISFK